MTPNCAECGQPLPQQGHADMLLVVELLDARDLVASLDPSATKFGFCDRGVELASLIHVSAHSGATSGLFRKAKRWPPRSEHEARHVAGRPRTEPGPARAREHPRSSVRRRR